MNSFGDETKFDDNGDPVAMYDLVTWQLTPNGEMDFVTIGKFDETTTVEKQKLKIQEKNIVWNGNQTEVGISIVSNNFSQVAFSVTIYSLCDFVVTNAVGIFNVLLRFPCQYAAAFVPKVPGRRSDLTFLSAAMIVWFVQLGRLAITLVRKLSTLCI